MSKCLLPLLLLISVTLLQAQWYPIEPTPDPTGDGACITYGGDYVWCFNPYGIGFYAYETQEINGWYELSYPTTGVIWGVTAITYESGLDKRIFVVGETYGDDQLFIYTRNSPTSIEGSWNQNPIYLPPDSRECGPGVSLAYQPIVENGFQIGGFYTY